MNPYIDRVLPFDWASATYLLSESFAAVYSFERTPSAASVVDRVTASHKAGLAYGGSHNGLYAMGEVAEHFFRMNTWNDFRVHLNKKTWTELYFAIAGYQYEQEAYVLRVPAAALARVSSLLAVTDRSRVCLNIGGSLKTKIWPVTHWLTIGAALLEENCEVVITGGVSDMDMCEAIHRGLGLFDPLGDRVHYSQLSIEEFAAVPSRCDVVVTGDSLGFHLALAHETPCVLLLGPSNGAEVVPKHATYVAALRSDLACSPCAHQVSCAGVGGCMDTIKPSKVLAETRRLLAERRDRRSSG
jgi:heptosyltransferase-2